MKRIILALWLGVAAIALAFLLIPSDKGYQEFAQTQVAVPPPVKISVASPVAVVDTGSTLAVVPGARKEGSILAPLSLTPLVDAITSAARPAPAATAKTTAKPSAAESVTKGTIVYQSAPLSSPELREEGLRLAGVDRKHFLKACEHDHDLQLAAGQRPLFTCRMLNAPLGPDTTPITTTPSYPTTATFLLHSRPSATRKVYLDFTGHTTAGTPWNTLAGWQTTFTTPPFSLDANTANVSDAEHAAIQSVWRRMAEDFASYDVDVTTEDPGADGLLKTAAVDMNYGMRVIFGPDQNATGSGGVAFVGSFGWTRVVGSPDVPCYVFAGTGASAKIMAEAGSHEVGHTLGLYHDGTSTQEYFPGHGTGATSWAPIMGVGYGKDIVQWSKGEYTDANNTQDDIAVMATYLPQITDEFGGTTAAATVVAGTALEAGGIIGMAADVDVIKIRAGRGNLVITPKVSLVSPNLRLQIKVLDAAGLVVGTYVGDGTAGNMAPAPITLVLPREDFYFIQLEGVANGDGVTDGYSDYGSIGYYSFTATWAELGNRPPVADATLSNSTSYNYQTQPTAVVNFNGNRSTDIDGVVTRYVWDFKDVTAKTAEGVTTSHRYKAPGTYYPTLTVFDDLGASATTTVTVTVTGSTRAPTCSLALISGSFARLNSIHDVANAIIQVQDQYGNPVRRALVYVTVSGLARGPRIVVRTNDLGQVSVTSPKFSRGARGTVVFTVTTVESPNRPYVTVTTAPVVTVAPSVNVTR